jgi:hypothetical protein
MRHPRRKNLAILHSNRTLTGPPGDARATPMSGAAFMRLREIISDPAECPSSSRIETVVAL